MPVRLRLTDQLIDKLYILFLINFNFIRIYRQEYIDKGYIVNKVYISVVLYIKKELLVLEYKYRSYIVTRYQYIIIMSLISHPYSN